MNNATILNPLGQAIYCDCYLPKLDMYKILGSVTMEGVIEIIRAHGNKTVIETAELRIVCQDCGYKRYIKIESAGVNRLTEYDRKQN